MKSYPSITRDPILHGLAFYGFDKLDGSQIRAEWSRKRGFDKFGSKNRLLDASDLILGAAPQLVQQKYSEVLAARFRKQRWERATCYFEFWSPNSFAGFHVDEPHTVTLFDIAPHKKGILFPHEYLDLFGDLDIARLLYHGRVGAEVIELIQSGKMNGMTFEGAVFKAKNPGTKTLEPIMFKSKNRAWIAKLKTRCAGDDTLFQSLL